MTVVRNGKAGIHTPPLHAIYTTATPAFCEENFNFNLSYGVNQVESLTRCHYPGYQGLQEDGRLSVPLPPKGIVALRDGADQVLL